ncbi:MAG: site-specific integrase [Anaerolineaceae bacterium]|nr:site-specific integrase [Anaerolineaceae bacterium]
MLKLSITQDKHLLKLLHMRYTISEIAEITGIDTELLLDVCWAGCPYEIDPQGTIWIIGTDLQNWLQAPGKWQGPHKSISDLINRDNYFDVRAFLDYRTRILQLDPQSVRNAWIELKHLLQWAGSISLSESVKVKQFFPTYLTDARNDGQNNPLCPAYMKRICAGVRMYFKWAKNEWPDRYKNIPHAWIDAIRLQRSRLQSTLIKREQWSLEEVMKIVCMPITSLAEQRDQAAICFMFLSGMRITAFVSLPIACVDMGRRRIEQLPEKGVLTKNHKAAITSLLPIPELLEIVERWDNTIRLTTGPGSPWYALIDRLTMQITDIKPGEEIKPAGRRAAVIEGMKHLCARAGVAYRSPHKLRHGHAVYGIKHARDMKDLKAISQNLMHSSIAITDGIYGNLTSDDVNRTMANLNTSPARVQPANDMSSLLQAMIKLQANPALLQTILAA